MITFPIVCWKSRSITPGRREGREIMKREMEKIHKGTFQTTMLTLGQNNFPLPRQTSASTCQLLTDLHSRCQESRGKDHPHFPYVWMCVKQHCPHSPPTTPCQGHASEMKAVGREGGRSPGPLAHGATRRTPDLHNLPVLQLKRRAYADTPHLRLILCQLYHRGILETIHLGHVV